MKLKITFYCYLWKTLFPLFVRLFNFFDVQNAHALFSHLQKVKAQSKCSSLRSDYFKTCFVMNITFMFVFVNFDVKPIKNLKSNFFRLLAKFTEDVTSSLEGNSLKVSGLSVKGGALIHRTIYQDVYNLIKTAVKIKPLITFYYRQIFVAHTCYSF